MGSWSCARALARRALHGIARDDAGAPPESWRDPDVLLLRAALQTHRGQPTEAEEACKRLLNVDELSAGAHYVLALCREGAGDRTSAVSHDQVAIYLDPSFAMPHQHLGLLARRTADWAGHRATGTRTRAVAGSARTARGSSCLAVDLAGKPPLRCAEQSC